MTALLETTQDDDLARRLQAGDATALSQAHAEHQAAMFAAAQSILRNRDSAFDVTQDVFTHLWEHPTKYDQDRGTLRSYLLVRTRSRALDILRSETSRRRRETRHHGDHRTVRNVDELVTDRNQAHALRKRLTGLDARARDAISLAFFEDLSYREVARHLEIPEGTAKSRIRVGLAQLRQEMGDAASQEMGDAASQEMGDAASQEMGDAA